MMPSSSAHVFGLEEEGQYHQKALPPPPPPPPLVQQRPASSSSTAATAPPPSRRKRNLPADAEVEVIALSPKSLLATNRFVCEVCNKGFQREQNLQLHRRGHNLPWKLKQKNPNEVRRRVYLCPEPTCVHHDPSRALGDLTGIKKHYCRKHGEKKWKCDKCAKRYAVQSDWKAHSKVCGTREYRCDCGTLFSRRDSFITHRAFCDALAQQNSRLPASLINNGGHFYSNRSINLGHPHPTPQLSSLQDQLHPSTDLLRFRAGSAAAAAQFDQQLNTAAFRPPPFYLAGEPNQVFAEDTQLLQSKPLAHGMMPLHDLQTSTNNAASLFNLEPMTLLTGDIMSAGHVDGPAMPPPPPSFYQPNSMQPMSATALLQKAAHMGATSSGAGGGSSLGRSFRSGFDFGENENNNFHEYIFNSLGSGNSSGVFSEQAVGFGGFDQDESKLNRNAGFGADRLTRDFLGVGGMMRSMAGGVVAREQQHLGIEMSNLEAEMKSTGRPFGGGRALQ